MNELALTESSALRMEYADQVEVLNEVEPVPLLADEEHASTEMVAAYFGVGVEAIKSLVKDNREELESNEYDVISGDALRSFKDLCEIPTRGRSYARFTERTVLFVAMLLRESKKARTIRTRLLDKAQGRNEPPVREPSRKELAYMVIEAEEKAELESARADKAEVRAIVAESTVKEIEGGDGLTPTAFHKKYFSDVRERDFFEHLYRKNYLLDQRGKGAWSEKKQRRKDGTEHRHPSFKGKAFFYLHFGGTYGDKRREHTRVRPGTPELALKAALIKDGLPANPHLTGLFALEGGVS